MFKSNNFLWYLSILFKLKAFGKRETHAPFILVDRYLEYFSEGLTTTFTWTWRGTNFIVFALMIEEVYECPFPF